MTASEESASYEAAQRKSLLTLLLRMTVYYLVVGALLALLGTVKPELIDTLPLGGVDDIANYDDPAVYELEEALLGADDEELEQIATRTVEARAAQGPAWLPGALSLLYAMFATLVLMIPVSWVYKTIHDDSVHDHSLDETALVLPAVVAGIVTIVQHSLALAFSLAGIVAGVQFRRALSDTFDTLFIFVAIGVGIAAGIKAVEIALVLTVFFNYATVVVCTVGDGLESQYLARKKRLKQERKSLELESGAESGQDTPG